MRTRILTLLLVVACGSMWATEIPTTKHTIDDSFVIAFSVYAADVDGDGDIDILGAAYDGKEITWWENPGGVATTDGTPWTEHTIDGSFNGAGSVYAADVDGDGNTDILGSADVDDDITWWENPGGAATTDGTPWTEHTIDGSFDSKSVFAADVDGDGDTDILGGGEPGITWWENPGGAATTDGTAWTEHTTDSSFHAPWSVQAADVDGDGDTDILGASNTDDDITWWENPGGAATTDGTAWSEHTIDGSFDGAFTVRAADVDGDGDTDILGAAFEAGDITWWENPGGAATTDGTPWSEHTIDASFTDAYSVYARDVDGDGDMDILGASSGDGDIAWWENPGGAATTDGTPWTEHTIDGSFTGAASVFAEDVDGDGDTDILGASAADSDIAWWENKTIHRSALFPAEHSIDADFDGATSVIAADVDSDGDLDVLGAAFDADDIAWWENTAGNGSAWTEHPIDTDFDGARLVAAADVDGDGDLDILGAGFEADTIAWWENPGGAATTDGTPWTEHTIDDAFDGARGVFAADMDRDGDIDILGAAVNDGDVVWWENTAGDGTTWTEHTIDDAFPNASTVSAADLDGDGDLDVAGTGVGEFSVALAKWENTNGDGTVWVKYDVTSAPLGFIIVSADLDKDGDLDLLGALQASDDIAWFESGGALHTIDDNFIGGAAVFAADLDGDGDLDVLAAADEDDDITWWENRGGQFALPTVSSAPLNIAPPSQTVVLRLNPVHKGRTSDTDAELVTLELLFDDGGTPLSDAEANSAIDMVRVYLDDGSGVFDGSDTQVGSVGPLSLTAGVQTISFVDGDMNVELPFGATPLYFVVIDFKQGATFNPLRVTHLTESSSIAEDQDHDIPLKLEFLANVPTPNMVILGGPGAGAGCMVDLVVADQTLSGTQTLQATTSATLGENVVVDGVSIDVKAPTVTILGNTAISGPFSIGNTPSCP